MNSKQYVLGKAESERYKVMMREKAKKEKEEILKFKAEDFRERKRLKLIEETRKKQELADEIKRNMEKSRLKP